MRVLRVLVFDRAWLIEREGKMGEIDEQGVAILYFKVVAVIIVSGLFTLCKQKGCNGRIVSLEEDSSKAVITCE